jgi:hypothetical protein
MGAASVAILEERKPVEHRRGGDAVETGEYTRSLRTPIS